MVLTLALAALLSAAVPAGAAATYTFYVSGNAVGETAPGVTKDYTLNLTNLNSTASISFNLSLVAQPQGWNAQLSQTSLTVGPSATRQVSLSVTPPLTALADSIGQYVNVTATPDDNTTAQTVSTTTRVTEVKGVDVTIIPTGGTAGDPGQNITWNAYVKNIGNSVQTFTVTVDNTSYTSMNLTTNLVTVSAGDTRVIFVTINISQTAPVGTLYSRLTATASSNTSVTDSVDFSASVNAKRSVGLSGLTPDDLIKQTEAEASVVFRNIIITNKGNVADSYMLQGTANASRHGEWASFESTSVSLNAFASRYFNVTVTVPASVTATGNYTVEFRIISDNSTSVIAFLNLTVEVTPKHDLKMVYESLVAKQSGEPGTTVSFPVNVSNPGAFDQRVDLNYSGPNSGWVTLSANPFTLSPGAYKVVYVNFSIPGTEAPSTFDFQLKGTINWTNPYRNRSVDLTLEVKQVYDVRLSTTASAASGLPGATATYTLSVLNNGTGTDNFTLSATNTTQAGVLTLSNTTISLARGASQSITVTIAIASAPAPATGIYYYGISAKSSGNVSKASAVNLQLTVNQTYSLTATVSPSYQTADPGTTATYTVSVTNTGNGADTFTLQRAGINQTWVSFPTGSGTIAAGGRSNFSVQVSTPSWTSEGDTVLTVKVASSGDANATASPTFTISINPLRTVALTAASSDIANAHRNSTYTMGFTLRNSGNLADTFTITITGADASWASLPVWNYSLAANQNTTFTVTITTPLNPSNGAHAFTVRASSLANSSVSSGASFNVTVNDIVRPEVRLAQTAFFAQPYATVSVAFTVKNNGTIADTFQVIATATFADTQFFNDNFTLNPGASANRTFVVLVNYSQSGTFPVVIQVISLVNSSFEAFAYANITLEVIRAVSVTTPSASAPGGPDDLFIFTLLLRNVGNITDTYALSFSSPGWSASFSESTVTLAPNEARNVTFSLQAPPTLARGTYSTTVTVASQNASAVRAVLNLQVQVSYALNLTPTSTSTQLLPGASHSFTVVLENQGSAKDQYAMSPTGEIASWVVVTPATANLSAGQTATVLLTVTVPLDQHEGNRQFALRATSLRDSTVADTTAFSVAVSQVFGFNVTEPGVPPAVSPGESAQFLLVLTNLGNGNDSFSFTGSPTPYVTFSPANASLDALRQANVTVAFTPPAGASAGLQPLKLSIFGGGGQSAEVWLNVTILQVYNMTVRSSSGDNLTGTGQPGTSVSIAFDILNRGNGADTAVWEILGEAAGWVGEMSGTVTLQPGASTLRVASFTLPSDPSQALAKDYAFQIAVHSLAGGPTRYANGSVRVVESPSFLLSFNDTANEGSRTYYIDRAVTRTHDIEFFVMNTGNRNETVQLSRSPPAGWSVTILVAGQQASSVTVAPGQTARAVLRISSFPTNALDDLVTITGRSQDGKAPDSEISVSVLFHTSTVAMVPNSITVSTTTVSGHGEVAVDVTVRNSGAGTATNVQIFLKVGDRTVDQEPIAVLGPGETRTVTLTWQVTEADVGDRSLTVELAGGSTQTAGQVLVSVPQKGFFAKLTGDRDSMAILGLGFVIGAGLMAIPLLRRRKRAKIALAPPQPWAGPAPEAAALAGLEALEAEGAAATEAAPPAPAPAPAVQHKVTCPECGTEQWIMGLEGDCEKCGVTIEVADEAEGGAPPAP